MLGRRFILSLSSLAFIFIGQAGAKASQPFSHHLSEPLNFSAADTRLNNKASIQTADPEPLLLAVQLNQQRKETIVQVLRLQSEGREHLLISAHDFKQWRFKPFIKPPLMTSQGKSWYALDQFKRIRYRLNLNTMSLKIKVPPSFFQISHLSIPFTSTVIKKPDNLSAFLNYDFLMQRANKVNDGNGTLEAGVSSHYGVLISNFLLKKLHENPGIKRLTTVWTLDNPTKMSTLRLGDSVTSSGGWGRRLSFGGMQWASNFSTHPDFVTYPTPDLTGEATIPTVLDLFIDNARVFHSDLQPGPFSIDHVPAVTGDGKAHVVTKDILGREQLVKIPFYVSNSLLKPGLHNYSFEAGVARQDYGSESNRYKHWVVVGSDRRGFSDHLTTGWHVELQKPRRTLGVNATYLIKHLATMDVVVAGSHDDQLGAGGLLHLGLDSQHHRLNLSASTQITTKRFTQLGLQPGEVEPDFINRAFVGYALTNKASLGLSYLGEFGKDFSEVHLITLNYRKNLAKFWHLTLSGVANVGAQHHKGLYLNLTHAVDDRTTASINAYQQYNAKQAYVTVNRSTPLGPGYGYSLRAGAGPNSDRMLSVSHQHQHGSVYLQAEQQNHDLSTRVNLVGGLATLGRHVYLTPRIEGSYGVVQVPGFKNIDVFCDNQYMGKTDKHGNAFVPDLMAYETNLVYIHGEDLPMTAEIKKLQKEVTPYYRSGLLLRFPVSHTEGVIVHLNLPSGKPVPVGAMAYVINEGKEGHYEFPVGFDGEVYLHGLEDYQTVHAAWNNQRCTAKINYKHSNKVLPHLGEFVCYRVP